MKRSLVSLIGVGPHLVKNSPVTTSFRFAIIVLTQLCCLCSQRASAVDLAADPGELQFGSRSYQVDEDYGEGVVEVVRQGGNTGTVSVHFTTLDGTAVAGTDYLATNGVLTFLPGEEYKWITIPILPVAETKCLRFFSVHLHSPGGGAFLGGQTNTMMTIMEDYIDIIPRGVTECITITHSNALRTTSPDIQWPYSITPNGRYVLFSCSVDALVANDNNASRDVFRRDLTTGITRLVSVNQAGTESANTNSLEGRMSGDGRYVVFQSGATNLTTNSVRGNGDVFVRDMEAGMTRLVSRSTNGLTGGNLESHHPMISSNGLVVAFTSMASDLVPSCPCDQNNPNIYALNLASDTMDLVTPSIREGTLLGGAAPEVHGMSADGRFILFVSSSDELVEGDTNGLRDLFVRDLQMKKTILVTQNYQGTGSADNVPYDGFQISPEGRFVLFSSFSSNLVPEDTDPSLDVFLRDLISGTTRLVSVNRTGTNSSRGHSWGGTMTPDGRYLAFLSLSRDLLPQDLPPIPLPTSDELFLRDMVTGTTTLVTVTCIGTDPFEGETSGPVFSGDGKRLFFRSRTRDLVPGSPPGYNVYMRDLVAGITTLVSANSDFTGGGHRVLSKAATSWDGKTAIYASDASDLAPVVDKNKTADLFVWRELLPGPNAQVNLKIVMEARGPVLFSSLAVTNLGPDTAHNIVVSNALSSGIHFVSFNTTGGSCSVAGNQILCALGDLSRRGGVVISLVATATGNGVVEQTASVTSITSDPLSLDNFATGAFTMTLPAPEALSIARIQKNIFINWLDTPAEFQLEKALTLDSPAEWSPAPLPTFNNGVVKTAIVTNEASGKAFYRLHRP